MLTEPQSLGTSSHKEEGMTVKLYCINLCSCGNNQITSVRHESNSEREKWQTIRTRPSATAIDKEREHNISDHMVGNKICTRHYELGRCTRLCNQDTAHVTSTKITDKQFNGGKGKPITKLPREDKNKNISSPNKKR